MSELQVVDRLEILDDVRGLAAVAEERAAGSRSRRTRTGTTAGSGDRPRPVSVSAQCLAQAGRRRGPPPGTPCRATAPARRSPTSPTPADQVRPHASRTEHTEAPAHHGLSHPGMEDARDHQGAGSYPGFRHHPVDQYLARRAGVLDQPRDLSEAITPRSVRPSTIDSFRSIGVFAASSTWRCRSAPCRASWRDRREPSVDQESPDSLRNPAARRTACADGPRAARPVRGVDEVHRGVRWGRPSTAVVTVTSLTVAARYIAFTAAGAVESRR